MYTRLLHIISILIIAWILNLYQLSAQSSHQNFLSTHQSSLGGILSISEGVNAIQANPAGISDNAADFSFIVSSEQRHTLASLNSTFIGTTVRISSTDYLAFSAGNFGIDEYKEQKLSFSYSKKIGPRTFIGTSINSYHFRIEEYGCTQRINLDLGFKAGVSDHVEIGFTAQNLFPNTIGASDNDPLKLGLGIKYAPSEVVFLVAESTWFSSTEKMSFSFGMNYQVIDNLSMQIGINSLDMGPSFGLSYDLSDSIHFYAGARSNQQLGITPSISLLFCNI